MKLQPVKLGLIGFGAVVERLHLPLLAGVEEIEVVAAFDPTPARQKAAAAAGFPVFRKMEDYLARSGAEASLVAAPSKLHGELTLACLAAGQHVIVEKPMAMSLEEGDRMIRAAREARRVLTVFHNRRYDPDFLAVREAVRSGRLGEIYSVDLRLCAWGSGASFGARDFRPQWRHEAAWGGGALYDWGAHFLDQLGQLISAPPRRAFALLRRGRWAKDVDDFARALIEFEDGPTAMVEVNYVSRYPGDRWRIHAEKGTLINEPGGWDRLKIFHAESETEEHLPRKPASPVAIYTSFARAIRGKGRPAISPESVRRTLRLLDACLQSAREARAVEF